MPIPDFQSFLLPVLELASDGAEHSLEEARNVIAARFNLTDEERAELLPTGKQRRFDNRVSWAKVYLQQSGLLSSSRRAHFQITDRGVELLSEHPERIDIARLREFPEFQEFHAAGRRTNSGPTPVAAVSVETPEEMLEQAYQSIRAEVASELLVRVKSNSPKFFETLVVVERQ